MNIFVCVLIIILTISTMYYFEETVEGLTSNITCATALNYNLTTKDEVSCNGDTGCTWNSWLEFLACDAGYGDRTYYPKGTGCGRAAIMSSSVKLVCNECPAGKYSERAASECSTCEAGSYSSAGASSCTQCTAGSYSSAGASSCTQCTTGFSADGAASCTGWTSCDAGYKKTAGTSTSDTTCTQCPAGKYSSAGASSCTQCPAGSYSGAGSERCTLYAGTCENGTLITQSSRTQENHCGSCESGYYMNQKECTPCQAGSYSSAGASLCSSCLAGSYSSAGASSCEICPPGYETDNGTICRICGIDTKGLDNGTCTSCKEYQDKEGSTDCNSFCKTPIGNQSTTNPGSNKLKDGKISGPLNDDTPKKYKHGLYEQLDNKKYWKCSKSGVWSSKNADEKKCSESRFSCSPGQELKSDETYNGTNDGFDEKCCISSTNPTTTFHTNVKKMECKIDNGVEKDIFKSDFKKKYKSFIERAKSDTTTPPFSYANIVSWLSVV